MANNLELIGELRASLKNSRVVTPESEDYATSIQRWSDVAERKAVRLNDSFHVLRLHVAPQLMLIADCVRV
jgi:hypothetical protein